MITAACSQHHVSRLYVFGSLLRPDYRPGESDIDLLVEFQPLEPTELVDAYFGLVEQLAGSLGTPVDLVMATARRNPIVQADISFDEYCNSRLIRAAVEKQFITVGEALNNLSRVDSRVFARIDQALRIISFRNRLTHKYDRVDDALVWGVIQKSLSPLRTTCSALIDSLQREES